MLKFILQLNIVFLSFVTLISCKDNIKSNNDSPDHTLEKKDNVSIIKDVDCSVNFPKEQEHLANAPCLRLPMKTSDFQHYPTLKNGLLDLDKLPTPFDHKEYLRPLQTDVPEYANLLGIIPYDNNYVWLLIIYNENSEEAEGISVIQQVYELRLFERKLGNEIEEGYKNRVRLGIQDLTFDLPFYNNPKVKKPPFNFKEDEHGALSYKLKDTVGLQHDKECYSNFTIQTDWSIHTDIN
ncbi:hypothetical protein, partial [Neisseria dumasiana]